MKKTVLLGSLVVVGLWSCGGKEEEQAKEEPKNAMEAIQQMADKAKEMQEKGPVDPVDFRSLKEILPASAAGLERTEATGEKNGAMGFSISQAQAKYGKDDTTMEVEIMDTGGVGGMAMMGMAAWAMADVDKETATGYEKTTRIDGMKAFEKYDNERKGGEVNVIVGDRFVVNVKGRNVTMDQIKDALGTMDLSGLAKLK